MKRPGSLSIITVLLALIALAAPLLPATTPDVKAQARPAEVRALWVDAFHDGIKSPAQVEQMVADARRANVNTLLVQVRRRGDLYYPGPEPLAADARPGFDALAAVIKAAHEGSPRLEVQAWLPAMPIWNDRDKLPPWPNHVLNMHGENAPGAQNWLMLRDDGEVWSEGAQLDPGHPDAMDFLNSLIADIVQRYDVDGIHLDRVRYPEGENDRRWGYNPVSVARFNQRHGRAGNPEPSDPAWIAWRRDQVTQFVRRTRDTITSIRPSARLSAAVVPWGAGPATDADWVRTSAYSYVFQDWRYWLQEGLVDQVYVMNYNRETSAQQVSWQERWFAFQRRNAYGRQVIAGLAPYLNTPSDTVKQIRRALSPDAEGRRLAGVALYSYAVPDTSVSTPDPSDDLPAGALWRALAIPGEDNEFSPPFRDSAALPPPPR